MLAGLRLQLFVGCSAAAFATAAQAAEPPALLEEVVVTVNKRAQSLQDAPQSITAVSGEALADRGAVRFEDLTGAVPNFSVSATPIGDTITIRGINSDAQSGAEQSVGTFVDGVFRGRGVQSRFSFLDAGSIEIVRGPQGAIFGKNTIAGAVNITSARPTASPRGQVVALHEVEHAETELRAFVSGPISDRLRLRAAAQYNRMSEGWSHNVIYDQDMPTSTTWATRLSAEADVTARLRLFAKYEHGAFDLGPQPFEVAVLAGPMAGALTALGVDGRLDGRTAIGNRGGGVLDLGTSFRMDGEVDEAVVRLDWEVANGLATLLYARSSYDYRRDLDGDNGPLPLITVLEDERYAQDSLEARFASEPDAQLSYLFGLYLQRAELETGRPGRGTLLNPAPLAAALPPGFPLNPVRRGGTFDQEQESAAGFGQVVWRASETVTLTAGARYSWEEKSAVQTASLEHAVTGAPLSAIEQLVYGRAILEVTPHTVRPERREDDWTWSLNAQWEARPGQMLYGTVSKGVKGGGFNAVYFATGGQLAGESAADWQARMAREIQYDPERAVAYELGGKFRWGGVAELNLALFFSRYENLQTTQFTGATSFIVGNAAEARSRGVEADGRWRVSRSLDLRGSLAYLDFEFTDFRNAGCTALQIAQGGYANGKACADAGGNDLTGRTSQDSPRWTMSLGFDYSREIGDYEMRLAADASYVDRYFASADLDPATVQKAFVKLDARLAIGPRTGRWELALVGRNLTDERTFQDANDLPLAVGSHRVTLQRPRSVALRATARF